MMRLCEPGRCEAGKCDKFPNCEELKKFGPPQPTRTPLQIAQMKLKAQEAEIANLKAQKDVRDEVKTPVERTPQAQAEVKKKGKK